LSRGTHEIARRGTKTLEERLIERFRQKSKKITKYAFEHLHRYQLVFFNSTFQPQAYSAFFTIQKRRSTRIMKAISSQNAMRFHDSLYIIFHSLTNDRHGHCLRHLYLDLKDLQRKGGETAEQGGGFWPNTHVPGLPQREASSCAPRGRHHHTRYCGVVRRTPKKM